RRVVLAWRKSFTRLPAMEALANAVTACELPGVRRLGDTETVEAVAA
ncbi:MAG TPA: LysR family transcriptional regulator, partial [Cupriavidus sp.]|nr:LysR family transcriptional regulator [Cupriavidus sp.]